MNAAAVDCEWKPTAELSVESWDETVAVNLSGRHLAQSRVVDDVALSIGVSSHRIAWPEARALDAPPLPARWTAPSLPDAPPPWLEELPPRQIVADTEPVIYRNFIEGAGTRAIGVGYPEKVNLAFDANNARLAMIWQGSFIDAQRHSTGRGAGSGPGGGGSLIVTPRQLQTACPFRRNWISRLISLPAASCIRLPA